MTAFERLRPWFPRVEEVVCMATHSFGPLLGETFQDLTAYAHTLRQRPKPPADWFTRLEEAYGLFERLLGAPDGSVAICASATACCAAILASIEPRGDRNRLLLADLQFPSLDYLCRAQTKRGFSVELVPSDGTHLDASAIAARIDGSVAAVVVPVVSPFNGALLDPAPIVASANAAGAIAILDGYAAMGIVPLDVTRMGPTVLIGGTSKWLSGGGTGLAFMYVHPELVEQLPPAYPGWLGSDHFMGFAYDYVPAIGARRYQQGTPAIEPIYTARAGMRFVLAQGVDALARRNSELLEHLCRRAERHGLTVRSPREPHSRAGILALEVPRPQGTVAELHRLGIEIDTRRGVVRLGPHWCVTIEECDRTIDAVAESVSGPRA